MSIRPSKRSSEITKQRVKQLRENQTEPERILWSILRGRKLGSLKFRRQHPIEPYIVDFYCAEAQLVIEIDGQSHDGREDYDSQRSAFLGRLGLTIMRIATTMYFRIFQVLPKQFKKLHLQSWANPSPSPSLQGRGTFRNLS